MTTRKRLTARRLYNRQLAQRDTENRCPICKLDLSLAVERWAGFTTPGMFCSETCLQQAGERDGACRVATVGSVMTAAKARKVPARFGR